MDLANTATSSGSEAPTPTFARAQWPGKFRGWWTLVPEASSITLLPKWTAPLSGTVPAALVRLLLRK